MKQIPHVGVSGILYEDGQILLGKRCDNDNSLPGLWNTPGGGLNFRETIADGIAREFREEVGLDVTSAPVPFSPSRPDFRHVVEAMHNPKRHTILIFQQVYRIFHPPAKPLDGLSEVKWATWQDIREMADANLLTPGTAKALQAFWRHLFPHL